MSRNNNFSSEGRKTLERRAKILELLENQEKVIVTDLSPIFDVSDVTIRNDLYKLEEKGLLVRTRGGAIKSQKVKIDYQLNKESTHHLKEKKIIGRKAAQLIKEGDTILLDSGTTTLEVAVNLINFDDLTVITNALNIAGELLNQGNSKVVMLGGNLRRSSSSFMGPMTENNIENLYCDKVFLGVNGIDTKYGISTTHIEDSYLNRLMIEVSKEVIVVTDSSKFLKRSFAKIAPIDAVNVIITDSKIPEEELKNLQSANIKVILADIE
jgi:DeoR family transcriptional regulator, aga operon transcriptional repressor